MSSESYTFNVNVRTPIIAGGGEVRLKDREKQGEARAWDERLTLEFDDARPCISAIEIKKIDNAAEQASTTSGFDKVAADGEGMLYMLGRTDKDVFKFSADGKYLNRFTHSGNSANAIAVDPVGRLFVAETSSIKVLDANGQKLADLKAFQAFGLAFNAAGEMFLASRPYIVKYQLDLE